MPEFVIVEKDGERLIIHPSTVDAHLAAHWKVVGESDNDGSKPAPKAKDKTEAAPEPPAAETPAPRPASKGKGKPAPQADEAQDAAAQGE